MSDRCLVVQPIHEDGLAVLRRHGVEVVTAPDARPETILALVADVDAVITRNAGLSTAAIDAARRLRVIGNHGIGLDPVDVERATVLGVPVVFTPHANAASVAELAVTLALAVAKRVLLADRATRSGDFGFKYRTPIRELAGGTMGIVGFGRIGRRTAEIFSRAFGMRVLVHSLEASEDDLAAAGATLVSLEDLLAASDVVSLHVPLLPSTRGLIGARELARMREGAILVNTARGALVDEAALVEALTHGPIGGAGLDVYASESMPPDTPLLHLPNVVLTPHIGGSTREAASRTAVQVAEQVVDVLAGRYPAHLVNPRAWEGRRR
jgi:D-3-phosphoglycerate dehydrogenase / 2-oxoglutarate reductase